MGFYIRKSISAGPFRFNLSSSGMGLSIGVPGLRVGTGPRGNYVHMGAGGLYYRAALGNGGRHRSLIAPTISDLPSPRATSPSGTEVETGNVLELVPSNGADILNQINKKMSLMPWWPSVLVLGAAISVFVLLQVHSQPLAITCAAIAVFAASFLGWWDQVRKTVVVMYDLDDRSASAFQNFAAEVEKLGGAKRVWNIDTTQQTADWKRNAGATNLISRKLASMSYGVPSVLKTNVSAPCILGGKKSIYFLPDVILVTEGARVGAVAYDQLDVSWSTAVFIEEESVPTDSQVVGHTWRYVNKKGGPDRRFNNNRQIPQVRYQELALRGPNNLQKILQLSLVADRSGFDSALSSLRQVVRELQIDAVAARAHR